MINRLSSFPHKIFILLGFLIFALIIYGSVQSFLAVKDTASVHQATNYPEYDISEVFDPIPLDIPLRFRRISFEQGLSQSVVECILQDRFGFIWIGTQDGLNRYDGYEFQIYRFDAADLESISDSYVQVLMEDHSGFIWIGTNSGGLNRFDRDTGQFTSYQHEPDNHNSLSSNDITTLHQDNNGIIWIGTFGGGLNRFDPRSQQFQRFQANSQDAHSLSNDFITSLVPGEDNHFWIGTSGGGVNEFDPVSGRFTHYQNNPEDPHSLGSNVVFSIYHDQKNNLWVGTDSGLDTYNSDRGRFTHYQNDPANPDSLCSNIVLSVLADQSGQLWVGTNHCLERLDENHARFVHSQNEPDNPTSLNNNQVQEMYLDRSGLMWLGTFGGGINLADPSLSRFKTHHSDPHRTESLSSNSVWSITADQQGSIWVGTAAGLDRFERSIGTFTHYIHDPSNPQSLRAGSVMKVYHTAPDEAWVGFWDGGVGGGLDRFDPISGVATHFDINSTVLAIEKAHDGVMWIGTLGLARYDPEQNTFLYFLNDPEDPASLSDNGVTLIYEDRENRMWVGTFSGGLNGFDPVSGKFTRFTNDPNDPTSISGNTILALIQDHEGVLWVGTINGLNRFDPLTNHFTTFTEKDGLANNVVYAIQEDQSGYLWMSTNAGLSRFDPQTRQFQNFDMLDGLPSSEYNQGASLVDQSGNLYFGGINGFVEFNPDDFKQSGNATAVVLTDLSQQGQKIELAQSLESTAYISLEWPDNYFDFEFSALSFTLPEKYKYAYILEGFDSDWNYTGMLRSGRYTNIPGGEYQLRIKVANRDGVWSDNEYKLTISVKPPVWDTWWFRLLVLSFVVVGVLGAFRLRVETIENQKLHLARLVEERTHELRDTLIQLEHSKEAAEAANRAKSIFLANMSHELRTPLNAILGFAQLLVGDENLTWQQKKNIEIINRSGEHLLGLINEILQLSKIEAGRISLNEQNFDLPRLLGSLEEMFQLRVSEKELMLSFDCDANIPQYAWMDESKLSQVLINLIGNAVKFTETGGIVIRAYLAPSSPAVGDACRLHFEVEDSGPGISPSEIESIFQPFEQSAAGRLSQEGTGLGLTISRRFVQMMGGDLTLTSPVETPTFSGGPGCRFAFEVNAVRVDASVLSPLEQEKQVIGLKPGEPAYKILVVEDNWANRSLLTQMLSPLGFRVREAENGKHACEIVGEWLPDLIIMDVRMPIMDGYEATRRIRNLENGAGIVIIALTASVLEEDQKKLLSVGCSDFLRKPFRESDLLTSIEKHLGAQFTYRDVHPEIEMETEPQVASAQMVDSMSVSDEILVELWRSTVEADLESINTAIDKVRSENTQLADTFAELAEKFDHDSILAIIRKMIPGVAE